MTTVGISSVSDFNTERFTKILESVYSKPSFSDDHFFQGQYVQASQGFIFVGSIVATQNGYKGPRDGKHI